MKYCFADPHMDYMHFLEECRKAEDEDKVGQIKSNPPKAKVAAATVPPTREDELAKQLRYQQHQIDTLVGQGCLLKYHGEEVQGAEVCLGRLMLEPLPSPGLRTPVNSGGWSHF